MRRLSEQEISLRKRYGVRTQRELIRAIRDDYNAECYDPAEPESYTTLAMAEVMLDGMLEAEYQRIHGS